jgi:hypothetical protein
MRKRNVLPVLETLGGRLLLSAFAVPQVVHVAAVVAVPLDDDPGGNDPLPEPEPPPVGDPPVDGPYPEPPPGNGPIPTPQPPGAPGPVGPGQVVSQDTLMPQKGRSSPVILEPVTIPPPSILA